MNPNQTLQANHDFVSFFRKRAELVNNMRFSFVFTNPSCKYRPTYNGYFEVLEDIFLAFTWLVPIKIRLPYTCEVDAENLQFLEKPTEYDFQLWKKNILSNYGSLELPQEEIEDFLNVDFNYQLKEETLFLRDYDFLNFTIGFNKFLGNYYCEFGLEIRKELFLKNPWKECIEFSLSETEITHNRLLLINSIKVFESKGFIRPVSI